MTGETRAQSIRQLLLALAPSTVLGAFFITLPLFAPMGSLNMFIKFFILAIFTMSLNLLFGYAGLFSLGHAAFFAAGAYATGILLARGVIESFWLVAPASALVAALLASIFGLIALRTTGIYFLLITLALGGLVYSVAWKWVSLTGGSDGLSGIPPPEFVFFSWSATSTGFYYFTFSIFVICYLLLYLITKSFFGRVLIGIRENELRMRCLGYNTWLYKYIAFILAGAFAGIAGVAFTYFNSYVTPYSAAIMNSAMVMLMVIIGGSGILFGSVIGAFLITFLEYYISLFVPERWPLIIGIFFIAVVMYARAGIAPYLFKIWAKVEQQYGSLKG